LSWGGFVAGSPAFPSAKHSQTSATAERCLNTA
jgi:hypothetical protein